MDKIIKAFKTKSVVIGEGIPKICMPMVGKTKQEIIAEIKQANILKPDLVEWRVDFFDAVNDFSSINAILKMINQEIPNIPIIFTCRDIKEGGFVEINPEAKEATIKQAILSGLIGLIDIELQFIKQNLSSLVQLAKENNIGVIISNHFFDKTPSPKDIVSIMLEEQSYGADIAKIAVMPSDTADLLKLLIATEEMSSKHAEIPLITISMGQLGVMSRTCGGIFGSSLTFCSGLNTSAPGQISINELRRSFEIYYKQ